VRVTAARGRQRDHEHPAADLGAHEPVRWRLGRVEQRVADPHITDVIDSEVRMLEQVRSLGVDFKRVFLIQQVWIGPLTAHQMIVLQTTTE
jgi:hypothetical protein